MTTPLSSELRRQLSDAGLRPDDVVDFGHRCLAEDLDDGEDVTSVSTVDPNDRSTADFVVRRDGVLAGVPVLRALLETNLPLDSTIEAHLADGQRVKCGDVIATVRARTIPLLTIERTALNVLCRLCGVATHTRAWVDALDRVPGNVTKVRDTRKTTPGMRDLEKYAVRCGGGVNHRRGLSDAVLIKDNHVLAAGGVGAALDAVARFIASDPRREGMVVQCEIDHLTQLDEAIEHGATQILLDNMSIEDMAAAVRLAKSRVPGILLEASGGLTLSNVADVASTRVDFVATGALTHSSPILDIALDFRTE
jgi:nicotinate-nucleotide pyrophosphorylase (carboxylating)